LCPRPHQDDRDAGFLGRQRQAPRGGEVERAVAAPGLQHDGPEPPAARRLHPGAQDADDVAHADQDQPRRIDPEGGETRRIKPACLPLGILLADPDKVARALHGAQGEARAEAGCRAGIGFSGRQDLVQAAVHQPAGKRIVNQSQAEAKSHPLPPGTGWFKGC
jgi:hypothetical protein